ncbi:MAG: transporter substrate-binding domain-containing protein [Kiloniellales bacterium]
MALCATQTKEREGFSHYPEEELLLFDTTLIVRSDDEAEILEDAIQPGKRFGIIKGYSFGGADDLLEAAGMSRIETPNRDALLKLLVLGRVDSVLDSTLPILYDAERLDLDGEVRPLYPPLASTPTYLLFSQAPGNEELSQQFSEALKAFKLTPTYSEIREVYGF